VPGRPGGSAAEAGGRCPGRTRPSAWARAGQPGASLVGEVDLRLSRFARFGTSAAAFLVLGRR
jgi:hypothetical protein